MHRLKNIAHRGIDLAKNKNMIENTVSSIKYLMKKNIDTFEIDVHMSKDKEIFLMHDKTLNRLALDKNDPLTKLDVSKLNWDQIKNIKIGDNDYKENFEYPSLLKDVLNILSQDQTLFIEVKGKGEIFYKSLEIAKNYDSKTNIVFISFDLEGLKELKRIDENMICYYLYECNKSSNIRNNDKFLSLLDCLKESKIDGINVDSINKYMTKKNINYCHNLDLKFLVWTNGQEDDILWNSLFDFGIDGFTTDKCIEFRSFLDEKI